MGDVLGFDIPLSVPSINLTSFFSSTWVWVAVIAFIGLLAIIAVVFILYLTTYNKKIIIFENVSGQGYQPVIKTRARKIKMAIGEGGDLLKTLRGGMYLTAYGRKMGKNTYWFAKGQDGFLYNILLGDLDAKMGMLDIEPVDRDIRAFQIVLDRYSHQNYGKQSFFEKYGVHMMLFLFLIVLVLGMWFIVGKIGDATTPLAQSNEIALKVNEQTSNLISKLDSLIRATNNLPNPTGGSGIVPVS